MLIDCMVGMIRSVMAAAPARSGKPCPINMDLTQVMHD